MLTIITHNDKRYHLNLAEPIDISIPLVPNGKNPKCFWAPDPIATPVMTEQFTGSIAEGGLVNFKNLTINPHGNGTHTECVGHILDGPYTINQSLTRFIFLAELISIFPFRADNGDHVIMKDQIEEALGDKRPEALIIRTLPNDRLKLTQDYSGKNPAYLHYEAAEYIEELDIKHLLLDLPSVDREEDDGKLMAHKAFWNVPNHIREEATITELIYVPNEVPDGTYFVNIQIAPLQMDASPSKPVLYRVV